MTPCSVFVRRLAVPVLCLVTGVPVSAQTAAKTVKVDCRPVLEKMRTDIAADPGRLILALEDALTTNEVCFCPIVRMAVDLAGRDPALSCQILIAAIHLLPASSSQITESVLLEAPDAAPAIRSALSKELGEKSPELLNAAVGNSTDPSPPAMENGKSPAGKQSLLPFPPSYPDSLISSEDLEVEFFPTVGVAGIYFTSPARAYSTGTSRKMTPEIIHRSVITFKNRPHRPIFPVTRSIPE